MCDSDKIITFFFIDIKITRTKEKIAFRCSTGVKPDANKNLHSSSSIRSFGKHQYFFATVRAAKSHKTPTSVH